jgi:hypothetical protein
MKAKGKSTIAATEIKMMGTAKYTWMTTKEMETY